MGIKEVGLQYSTHNFVKYWPIFKILSLSPEICNKAIIKYPTSLKHRIVNTNYRRPSGLLTLTQRQ